MSEIPDGQGQGTGRLDEARKVATPMDESTFEGRHSEPRDPTNGPVSEGPVAEKLSDPVGGMTEGSEASTAHEPLKQTPEERARSTDPDHISFMRYASPSREAGGQSHSRILSFAGVGAHPLSTSFKFPPSQGLTNRAPKKFGSGDHEDEEKLPHWQYPNYLTRHTTGRNAQFYGLTKAEREHLGGVEYRAITLLAWVVPVYFVLWQLLGCVGLGAYMAANKASTSRENGFNPW